MNNLLNISQLICQRQQLNYRIRSKSGCSRIKILAKKKLILDTTRVVFPYTLMNIIECSQHKLKSKLKPDDKVTTLTTTSTKLN